MVSIVTNKEYSTIVLGATDVIKTISKDFGSGIKSLEDTSGADYKPPAGRRFIIQSVFWTASDTSLSSACRLACISCCLLVMLLLFCARVCVISVWFTIFHEQLIFNSSFVCHNPKGDNSPQIAIPLYKDRYTRS